MDPPTRVTCCLSFSRVPSAAYAPSAACPPTQLHAVETCVFSTFPTLIIKHRTEPAVWARITYSILWESRSYFQLVQTNLINFLPRCYSFKEIRRAHWRGNGANLNAVLKSLGMESLVREMLLKKNTFSKCAFNQWVPICGVALTNDVCISGTH